MYLVVLFLSHSTKYYMKSRVRFHIHERLRRIHYIKTELDARISNCLLKNSYINFKTSYVSSLYVQSITSPRCAISRHRILCPLNSSFKLVNRNFRLSRFSINTLAKTNKIAGLLKRGW